MKRNTLGVTLLKCLLLFLIHEAFSPTLNSNAAQLKAADTTLITNLNGSVTAYTFTPLVCFMIVAADLGRLGHFARHVRCCESRR